MEYELVVSKQFEKAYKKFASKDKSLRDAISKALKKLSQNPSDPTLRTHKLSGKLAAYLSCYCGFDCRIIFTIEKNLKQPYVSHVILLDIGTHDEVY